MSVYDVNDTGDLYGSSGEVQSEQEQAEEQAQVVEALTESLEVLANPAMLLTEVLPPNSADSGIPMGLAVLGACAVAVIWANSISGGKRK